MSDYILIHRLKLSRRSLPNLGATIDSVTPAAFAILAIDAPVPKVATKSAAASSNACRFFSLRGRAMFRPILMSELLLNYVWWMMSPSRFPVIHHGRSLAVGCFPGLIHTPEFVHPVATAKGVDWHLALNEYLLRSDMSGAHQKVKELFA
jgi:hypothetical protein